MLSCPLYLLRLYYLVRKRCLMFGFRLTKCSAFNTKIVVFVDKSVHRKQFLKPDIGLGCGCNIKCYTGQLNEWNITTAHCWKLNYISSSYRLVRRILCDRKFSIFFSSIHWHCASREIKFRLIRQCFCNIAIKSCFHSVFICPV